MKTILNATEARNRFFEMINAVLDKGEEFIIKRDGTPVVRVTSVEPHKKSPEEITKIMREMREIFAKSRKRKYWSVLETPAWKKKERKYLENLSKGIVK